MSELAASAQAHPFDAAIALRAVGEDYFEGHTSPAYWNMVGPFGGLSAAVALNAVLCHPRLLGEPVALTVNFASALADGPFTVQARPVRTNRSTQHWIVALSQPPSEPGGDSTVLSATVMTAARRDTWGINDVPMPMVPTPLEVARLQGRAPVEWLRRYDMRPIGGWLPRSWDGSVSSEPPERASLSQLWLRDDVPRALDFCSLAAYADIFFPRVWQRRARHVPVGTVSFTVYFHVGAAVLAPCGEGYVLGQARGQTFYNGYFDQSAWLWSEQGTLLASSTQLVYYKE